MRWSSARTKRIRRGPEESRSIPRSRSMSRTSSGCRSVASVPAGYYERSLAAWVPSGNGRVVRADFGRCRRPCGTGCRRRRGWSTTAIALATLGVTVGERQKLAALYQPGQSLWRVPIPHFSPWDLNYPVGPASDAGDPNLPQAEVESTEDDHCQRPGSIYRMPEPDARRAPCPSWARRSA